MISIHPSSPNEVQAQRLLISIIYSGPYDRLSAWAWGIDRKTGDLKVDVRDGTWRARLANWADRRDYEWRERYVEAGILPNKRWKRKTSGNR